MDTIYKIKEVHNKAREFAKGFNREGWSVLVNNYAVVFRHNNLPSDPEPGIPAMSTPISLFFYENGILHNNDDFSVVNIKYSKYYYKGREVDKLFMDNNCFKLSIDEIIKRKHELDVKLILSRKYLNNDDLFKLVNALYKADTAEKIYELCKV